MKALLLLLLALFTLPAHAGVEQISEPAFRALAQELSGKVNLFHDAWEKDPQAQFYGGTTRDYLYWLKGEFREAHTPAEAARVVATLRARPAIDVREFIIGDSDVDLFSQHAVEIKPELYGVKKIDVQKSDVLDPTSELGRNEVDQGFIPAEKIRLTKDGLETRQELGDGIREIYSGKLTVHFATPEAFARSKYAAEGINHPILLAIRYLRLQGINYFQEHGAGPVDEKRLFANLDPASREAVERVIASALDGKELQAPLEHPQFEKWINAGIKKAFRSYTNPNATKALMEKFRVTELPGVYPEKIEPVNQYVFAKHRDPAKVAQALREYSLDPAKLYLPATREFTDGFLYHGTRSEAAFRAILLQGVLESEDGSGGKGLYGVPESQKAFAGEWGKDKERLLRFPVKPDARIIDVTEGPGQMAWDKFTAKHGADYEAFAEAMGADIVRYPYGETRAYVVKNSEALGRAQGVYREVLPLPKLLERMKGVTTLDEFRSLLSVNALSTREALLAATAAKIPMSEIERSIDQRKNLEEIVRYFFPRPPYSERVDLYQRAAPALLDSQYNDALLALFRAEPWRSREDLLIDFFRKPGRTKLASLLGEPGFPYLPQLYKNLREEIFRDRAIDLLPIFRNEAYAGEVEDFRQVLKSKSVSYKPTDAARVLAADHWTKHPDLAAIVLDRELADDSFMNTWEFFTSPAWNRDQRAFLRRYLAKYLQSGSSRMDYGLADILKAPVHPFTPKMVDELLERRVVDHRLVKDINQDYLRPYRGLIKRFIMRQDPPDYAWLAHLHDEGLLSPKEAQAATHALEAMLQEYEPQWAQDVKLLYRARSLTKDSPLIAHYVEQETERALRSPGYAAAFNEMQRHVYQELPWAKEFAGDLERWQRRWLSELEQPARQELLRDLLRELPPISFQPFVEEALRSPLLPPALRAELDRNIEAIVRALTRKQGVQDTQAALRLARLVPGLGKDEAFLAHCANAARYLSHEGDAKAALYAVYLHEVGKFPADLRPVIERNHDFLLRQNFAVPDLDACPTLYGKVGGA